MYYSRASDAQNPLASVKAACEVVRAKQDPMNGITIQGSNNSAPQYAIKKMKLKVT